MTPEQWEQLHARETQYRLSIARLLDAIERYPDDLYDARLQASAVLDAEPLWCEIEEEQ